MFSRRRHTQLSYKCLTDIDTHNSHTNVYQITTHTQLSYKYLTDNDTHTKLSYKCLADNDTHTTLIQMFNR